MSTTNSGVKKFSFKLNKNVSIGTKNPKTVGSVQGKETIRDVKTVSDDVLTRMAIEEIVRETAKGAIRAEKVGPSGWLPCPLMKTNKRFLRNTIKSVISHNRSKTYQPKKTEEELNEIIKRGQKRKPKFGDRKHCFRKPNFDRREDGNARKGTKQNDTTERNL
ncbi:Protein POLR1D, isoform 2 [Pseudolycoriella hygida]|uniref:Protein POLR1D, isoform 2 n=1 Tax=Pseudolycoriella hygida TaxID=35572 RepID=A0A9Q0MQT4_9DIPT|nr:Protein POLR1D, isoform 2 [Pseudolycoriella hygida]